jgi:anti-sigma factor RsiW
MVALNEELSCQELVELVTDYFEGALSPPDRSRFEAHIGGCDGCDSHLEQMRITIQLLGLLPPDSLDPRAESALLQAFKRWKAG